MDRRMRLPKKARRYKNTEVILVKTAAKSSAKLDLRNFKNKRRSFNRALQKTGQQMNWRSINIDSILPTNLDNFDETGEDLSPMGFKLYWKFLSEDVKLADLPQEKQTYMAHKAIKNSQSGYHKR